MLRAGLVITIEPFLTLGATMAVQDNDGWTLRSSDGSLGAQFEHTIGVTAGLGGYYYISLAAVAGALAYEHRSAAALDVAGINCAFFWSNAFVGGVFVLGVLSAVLWQGAR